MTKIVQVANAIITNKDKISDVFRNEKEYFFLYNNKYKWSISSFQDVEDYYLFFYPSDNQSIEELSNFSTQDWDHFSGFATYKSSEIKTREALETFRELYQIVSDKIFGLDDIFDEIINE